MSQSTIVGEYIDPEHVALARKRLAAFAERHAIDLEHYGAFEQQDDADWVDSALSELYFRVDNDTRWGDREKFRQYRNAVAVFRRAIGHSRARCLRISDGRAYAAW